MAINPMLLMSLLRTAPALVSALKRGYDPGIMGQNLELKTVGQGIPQDLALSQMNSDMGQALNSADLMGQQFPSDGAGNGLTNLFAKLNPNQWQNIGGPQAALSAATFENSPDPMGPHPTGDPTYASHLGELLHDTDGSQDEDARQAYLEWLKTHGYR